VNPASRQERFANLVDAHKRIVYKVCNAYCAGRDDRDDLAQEIVAQLWRSFPTYDASRPFATWMYRVALNVALSFRRRERSRTRLLVPDGEPLLATLAGEDSPPLEVLLVRQFVESLDDLNKALVLLYLDGHSYREIADVLGISETNVGTKLNRLKQNMRRELGAPGKT
jgi:RNA polymerase sigma-70 factor (ECF subfamily)